MATLTVQTVDRAGFDLASGAVAAAGGGDDFVNDGNTFVYVNNGGGGSINVTLNFRSGLTVDGVTPTSKVVAVAAGVRKLIGPFPTQYYADTTTQKMALSYSGVTSVTVAALKLTTS